MLTVKFNDHDEFLDELQRDPPPSKILRLTQRLRRPAGGVPICGRSVVATYENARREIVLLDCGCGEDWNHGSDADRETRGRVKDRMEAIEKAAKVLGLEVRAGVLEAGS